MEADQMHPRTGIATTYLLRRFMIAHLGGCTGDTLGATVEVVEAVVLVMAASRL